MELKGGESMGADEGGKLIRIGYTEITSFSI